MTMKCQYGKQHFKTADLALIAVLLLLIAGIV
jgi:hypothetical protein